MVFVGFRDGEDTKILKASSRGVTQEYNFRDNQTPVRGEVVLALWQLGAQAEPMARLLEPALPTALCSEYPLASPAVDNLRFYSVYYLDCVLDIED